MVFYYLAIIWAAEGVSRLWDRAFGPADFCVVQEDGFYFAEHQLPGDEEDATVVCRGLRWGAAQRLARHLRQKAEDQPTAVL